MNQGIAVVVAAADEALRRRRGGGGRDRDVPDIPEVLQAGFLPVGGLGWSAKRLQARITAGGGFLLRSGPGSGAAGPQRRGIPRRPRGRSTDRGCSGTHRE